jgi:thiosulfate reductase cytochrome b subunit
MTSVLKGVQTHSIFVRVPHWLMAVSVLVMTGSGWRIYNAAPIFGFRFPEWATLGGTVETALARHNDPGLANALLWHFAGMWVLVFAWLLFLAWGVFSGHFRRDFLPVGPRRFWRDFVAASRLGLPHTLGEYNAVQKAFYWGVLAAILGIVVSGIAVWKPVQTYPLELLFGGFQGARLFHFLMMAAIMGFLAVHVALAALVPRTLLAMITGRAVSPEAHE